MKVNAEIAEIQNYYPQKKKTVVLQVFTAQFDSRIRKPNQTTRTLIKNKRAYMLGMKHCINIDKLYVYICTRTFIFEE